MFYQSYIILAILALITCLILAIHRALTSPLTKIPGPSHTLVTDLLLLIKEFTYQRRSYIHSLHQQYGPIVRLGPNEISFTSPSALKEIYTSSGSGYDKTEFYTLFMQFGQRTMFSSLLKEEHTFKKRWIAGGYTNTHVMNEEVIGCIEERMRAFVKKCEGGKSVDVYVWLHCYALDCASMHLLHPHGTKSLDTKEDFKMMQEQAYHNGLPRELVKFRWPALSALVDFIATPRPSSLANSYVLTCTQKTDLSEHSLIHRLQKSGQFKHIQMAAECADHLEAGIDTTGDALTFLMHHLSLPSSKHVQESVIAELRGKSSAALDELPYLEAVIKEGLRCFPVIPMSQPRYVPAGGRTIDGYFIPAGTVVSAQAWSVHRLNEDMFPDGATFNPERWLVNKAKAVEMNHAFFAFGLGGRGCTGRHLAMAEMRILLWGVYTRFRTRVAMDMEGDMSISDQIIASRPLDQTCKLVFEPIDE